MGTAAKKVFLVFGTRPEAIKMAPVYFALNKSEHIDVKVIATGQHDEMLKSVLDIFGLEADINLKIMSPNQTLSTLTSKLITSLDALYKEFLPDIVLVHGDTTTAFCAALTAFYNKIKIGHVEAGLRTFDLSQPFPEEWNRQSIDLITDFYFAPTEIAKKNLMENGRISENKIFITGNTVIDALFFVLKKVNSFKNTLLDKLTKDSKRIILITAHRRENFGDGIEQICEAIKKLSATCKELNFVYPVHLNPNIKNIVYKKLENIHNVFLLPPLDYTDFILLMKRSYIILTDSGGLQEEAPALDKPVIVLRNKTERPEAVINGNILLGGVKKEDIIKVFSKIYNNSDVYKKMSEAKSPYGDGTASDQILNILKTNL